MFLKFWGFFLRWIPHRLLGIWKRAERERRKYGSCSSSSPYSFSANARLTPPEGPFLLFPSHPTSHHPFPYSTQEWQGMNRVAILFSGKFFFKKKYISLYLGTSINVVWARKRKMVDFLRNKTPNINAFFSSVATLPVLYLTVRRWCSSPSRHLRWKGNVGSEKEKSPSGFLSPLCLLYAELSIT